MLPYLKIENCQIPSYFIMTCIGILAAFLFVNGHLIRTEFYKKGINIFLYSGFGAVIGGKCFGVLSVYFDCLYNTRAITIEKLQQAGIVYWGGALGYLLFFYIICKIRQVPFDRLSDSVAMVLPLFHFFGRIGCFLAGCCYGKDVTCYIFEVQVTFQIPIQIIEAIFEIVIFFVLWKNSGKYKGQLLNKYLVYYAMYRFMAEFLRADMIRGIFWGISFSQWICIIILAIYFIKYQRRKML